MAKRSGGEKHPAERFVAPSSIQRGRPMWTLVDRGSVELLADSLAPVVPGFDRKGFVRRACEGLEGLGLMERGARVGEALGEALPEDFDEAGPMLAASLGPELVKTEGNGLATFFYLPHSCLVGARGVARCESGLDACYALTKRFTAEFCIRPFLVEHPEATLERLKGWTADANPHVRRLVSEGSRPRLPWGMRLRALQANPEPNLELLELLKDDPELYVRRSVANHLADVWKDHPERALSVCERWIAEAVGGGMTAEGRERRLWMVRHALRLPAKKGEAKALKLRRRAERGKGRGRGDG